MSESPAATSGAGERAGSDLIRWSYKQAKSLHAGTSPRRWAHSRAVMAQAVALAPILGDDCSLLAAAAILHDVGYRDDAVRTGQHMIDGAVFLRDVVRAPDRICRLVAHHTSSRWETHELGLGDALAEFAPDRHELVDAMTYCDLTAGPNGGIVDPGQSLDELLARYGPDHAVFRAVTAARPELLAMCARVEQRLAESTSG